MQVIFIIAEHWILICVNLFEKHIIVLDPMAQYTFLDAPAMTDTYIPVIEAEINMWTQTLQNQHASFTPWRAKPYRGKCKSYDVVTESCDSGVAVLSCIQFFENDLIPLYNISDLSMMRKKIYFNILNGEFPAA